MRALLLALAFAALATPALAAPVALAPTQFSPAFQEKLEDELGVREGPRLHRIVEAALTRFLTRAGGEIAPGAPLTVETTIIDARANRFTFQQLSDNTSRDYGASRSIGGAEIVGVLRAADGRALAEVSQRWYVPTLAEASIDDWGDARISINRYARKVADAYRGVAAN